MFVREPIGFEEGTLVWFTKTGEHTMFGRVDYSCNWLYCVWTIKIVTLSKLIVGT